MKMRGDASVIALWRAPEQWERSAGFGFTCLIGLQLFVRMEGARQAGEANYTKGSLNLKSKNLLARSRWATPQFHNDLLRC
jgi:hypothetical protein